MATQDPSNERIALLQGILDVLILRTLLVGPQHGQGIARAIQEQSQDVLLVDHGTIHPALQRLESKGWIDAKWGTSANNHRGRFYTQRQQKLCTNLTISAQAQSLLPAATPPQRCRVRSR